MKKIFFFSLFFLILPAGANFLAKSHFDFDKNQDVTIARANMYIAAEEMYVRQENLSKAKEALKQAQTALTNLEELGSKRKRLLII